MKIQVTQEDIDKGQPIDCFKCPVALATSRILGQETQVRSDFIIFDSVWYDMPIEVCNFIKKFDNAENARPLEFDINLKGE